MKHYLNEIEIAPDNLSEIGITANFTDSPNTLEINTDSIKVPREGYNIIKQHIETLGLFEGIPYRVQLEDGTNLEYYVDLLESLTVGSFRYEVKIKKRKNKDNFKDRANGVSYDLLRAKGVSFNLENIPYVVIKENQLEQALTLAVTTFILGDHTIRAGKEALDSISELIKAVTPNLGLGVTYDTGDIIDLSLKVTFRIIYFAFLLIALLELASQLFILIFQPIRKLKGCKVKELLVKGCSYIGYTFKSTLLDALPNLIILPVPIIKERDSIFDIRPESWVAPFNYGIPSVGDSVNSIGQLIDALEIMFNAKIRVLNGEVQLERRDYWQNLASAQILPALTNQNDRIDEFTYNTGDVWKRYYIKYTTDFSDLHTLDGITYDESDVEYSTEPLNTVNSDLVSIKGLNEALIPFSLGARKSRLTWLEVTAKALFTAIDTVSGLFGGGTNFASQISERKDVLKVSSQYWGVTKILYAVNGKQQANYLDFIGASALWNKYHYINSITLNSYILKEGVRFQIKGSDFVTLLNSNYAEINGLICEILEIEYIDEKKEAIISYKEPSNYASGKVEIIRVTV